MSVVRAREWRPACGSLLARAQWLPFSHLPGVTPGGAAAWQAKGAAARLATDPDAALLLFDSSEAPRGVALIHPLPWDSAVLGLPAGRVALCVGTGLEERSAVLRAALDHARAQGWKMLDLQAHVNDLDLVEAAALAGFHLVVTHLGIVWDLARPVPETANGFAIRVAGPADAAAVGAAAAAALDPDSRFALDPRLPPGTAERVFAAWGGNGPRGYADLCHVAERDGRVVGYCNWKRHAAARDTLGVDAVNLDLIGVVPGARGEGVLTALAAAGLRHWQAAGCGVAEVVTHVLNAGMQRACGGTLGGRTRTARHTFHWHAP